MRRSGTVKFPHSMQLFKFCQKVLYQQRNGKVHDQEVGAILGFNPSDCSHWKRGEKNVKSVFALAKLAESLGIEETLIHDVGSGAIVVDEAYFDYMESRNFQNVVNNTAQVENDKVKEVRERTEAFVAELHKQSEFSTPPLYLPEVMRFFSFVATQQTDMMDKLSRILRVRPGQYTIQYRKGDLKPQTRMSMARDLARIIFEGERARFPELGGYERNLVGFESLVFIANLFLPKPMLLAEMAKLDSRSNVIAELANQFWVPKSLVGFQMQDILRSGAAIIGQRHSTVTEPIGQLESAI